MTLLLLVCNSFDKIFTKRKQYLDLVLCRNLDPLP